MKNDVKRKYVLFILIFFTLIFLLNVFHPKAEFSENENRNLAQFAMPTVATIKDGSFMENFESFASDQFIGRDFFISMKVVLEKLLGKKENNGVIFAENDYLIAKTEAYNEKVLNKNLNAIKELNNIGRYKITLAVVPTAFEVLSDYLPEGAYTPDYPHMNEYIKTALKDTNIKYAETDAVLKNHKNEYIYYRTDHHQTTMGSYFVYSALSEHLGFSNYERGEFTAEYLGEEFYGTNWSKAKVMGIDGDTLLTFNLYGDQVYTVDFPLEGKTMEGLYKAEHLLTKDKYATFLDGNHALSVIRSDCGTGKRLAVIKDSYAHSVIPFLSNHYSEIHMLDLRYYNDDIIKYFYQNKLTDVLVLYNSNNFMTDTNLEKLGASAKTSDFAHMQYGTVEETEPVTDEYFHDAVFIGDSLTGGMSIYSGLTARYIYATGMSTLKIENTPLASGLTILDTLAQEENVGKVYIMLGMNELNEDLDGFIQRYGTIIDKVISIKPGATVYVQSILPVSLLKEQEGQFSNARINEINGRLEKMAEEKSVFYLKVGDSLRDENGYLPADITYDGIHLVPDSYGTWLNYLKNHAVPDGEVYKKSDTKAQQIEFKNSKIDVGAISKKIADKVEFKDTLAEININLLTSLYGINPDEVLNASIYMGGGATAEEIAVFELKDKKSADAIEKKILERIENKKHDFENYIPQEMTKLNNPLIVKTDKLIILCLSDDNDKAEETIKSVAK